MSMSWGREQQGCSVTNLQGTLSLSQTSAVNWVGSFLPPALEELTRFSVSFSRSSTSSQTLLTGCGVVVVEVVVVGGGVDGVPARNVSLFNGLSAPISSPVVTTSCRDDWAGVFSDAIWARLPLPARLESRIFVSMLLSRYCCPLNFENPDPAFFFFFQPPWNCSSWSDFLISPDGAWAWYFLIKSGLNWLVLLELKLLIFEKKLSSCWLRGLFSRVFFFCCWR